MIDFVERRGKSPEPARRGARCPRCGRRGDRAAAYEPPRGNRAPVPQRRRRPGDKRREIVAPHGVSTFERQLEHLRRRYRVVERETSSKPRGGGDAENAFPWRSPSTTTSPVTCRLRCQRSFVRTRMRHSFCRARRSTVHCRTGGSGCSERSTGGEGLPELVGVSTGATIHELSLAIEYMSPDERTAVADRLEKQLGPDPDDAGIREQDVQRLVEADMTIGFHTRRRALVWLSDDALDAALRDGRAELEQAVGHALDVIAYPHGHADDRVAEAARAAGFVIGFGVADQAVWPDSDPLLQGRSADLPVRRTLRDPACAGLRVVGDERAAPSPLSSSARFGAHGDTRPSRSTTTFVRALVGGLTESFAHLPGPVADVLDVWCGSRPYEDLLPAGARCVGLDVEGNPYGVADVVSDALLPFADESTSSPAFRRFSTSQGPSTLSPSSSVSSARAAPSSSRRCSVTGTSAPTSRRGTPSKCSARSSPAGTTSTFARTAGARSRGPCSPDLCSTAWSSA